MKAEAPDSRPGEHAVAFEAYGQRVRVAIPDPQLAPRVVEQFPVHAAACDPDAADQRFAIEADDAGNYALLEHHRLLGRTYEIDDALALLRRHLAFFAVDQARDHLVVSAGAVGHEGRGILLPGPTMSGTSTLVAALLRAGAAYYTDDWAVLDGEGRVHPSSRTLRGRGEGWLSPESLGAAHGDAPIGVGVIARTSFNPEARWQPRERTGAAGVMMLLGHAYGMADPAGAMKIAHSTVAEAVVIEGERGEADEAAAALLELAAQPRRLGSS